MIQNFKYFIVFTSAPSVLPEQNDRYQIQPWKVNEIKAYKNMLEIQEIFDRNLRRQYWEMFNKIRIKV